MCSLMTMLSCAKSKEVHPELGDGNEEFITIAATTAHVEYTRSDIAELRKVVFHYSRSGTQQFAIAEMAKKEDFFELTLNDLVNDTLYQYYYELFPNNGETSITEQKTFHTLAVDSPVPPTPPVVELPAVVTAEVSEITANSAICGGEVTFDGGAEVIERGVCWGINENPTMDDIHVAVGNGIGSFLETISGLEVNTTYHVRAYAINEAGMAYGLDKEFTTLSNGGGGNGNAPIGAIDGLFTINENGDKVYFSQGNLQYQASTNTWRFAEYQWDYVGNGVYGTVFENDEKSNNCLIFSDYSGWIDLFGWGTSGNSHGATCYQPWSTSSSYSDYYVYGSSFYNLNDQTGLADWGNNEICNGGSVSTLWRSLTKPEWLYLLEQRTTDSGMRYAKAIINGINGVILVPDNWDGSVFELNNTDNAESQYSSNVLPIEEWSKLESNGAIFLPAACFRYKTNVDVCFPNGNYWSSTGYFDYAFHVYFNNTCFQADRNDFRYFGYSVRLVQDAKPSKIKQNEKPIHHIGMPFGAPNVLHQEQRSPSRTWRWQ